MKQLMVMTALALSGCVAAQEDAPVQFTSAVAVAGAPGTACTADTAKLLSRGRLNLVGGGNYTLAMQVRSTIPSSRSIIVGGTSVNVGGETATLTELVYSYEGPANLALPAEETVATYTVLKAASSESTVFLSAFGPKALTSLLNAADSGRVTDTPVGIIATIKARGRLGTTGNLESNEFSFPLSIVNAPCPAGQTLSSICNAGQEYSCAASSTTTP